MQLRTVLDTHISSVGSIDMSSIRVISGAFDLAEKYGVPLDAVLRPMSARDLLWLIV